MTELKDMSPVKTKEIEMVQKPLTEIGGNIYYKSTPTALGKMRAVKTKIIEMIQSPIKN